MISSNTRASRSRFSSPAQQPRQNGDGHVKGSGAPTGNGPLEMSRSSANEGGSRSFMEKWLEPSVQNKTSYEQAGLMRYGVLENMAPLGTMPKARQTGHDGSTVRRIILRPSGAHAANSASEPPSPGINDPAAAPAASTSIPAAASTPDSPPPTSPPAAAPAPRTSSRPPARRSLAARDADDDNDYDPKKTTRRKPTGRPSLPKRGRPPGSARRSSMASAKTSPVKHRSTTPQPQPQPLPESRGPEFVERVIEAAVDEALHHCRYPTAWALRTLYDEKAGDAAFVSLIEEVFGQTADARTVEEFSRQLEQKKREGKRDNQGREYFVPPEDRGFAPHKPKPAPYAKLIHRNANDGQDEGEKRATKKLKISHRSHDNTPRKMASSTSANEVHGGGGVKTPSSRRRARRDSGSSISSLSSVENLSSPELPEDSDLVTSTGLASPSLRGAAKAKARAVGATGDQSPSQARPRPITTRGKSLASAKQQQQQQAVSNASGSNSPTLRSPTHDTLRHHNSNTARLPADDASMPGRLASSTSESFPIRDKSANSVAKGGSTAPTLDVANDEAWKRRQDAQRITNGYAAVESSIRDGGEDGQATPVRKTRKTRQSILPSASTRATRSANKRLNDESDRFASPGAFSASAQGDGSSAVGSRAVTPSANLRPPKKQKTGLRVKSSPVKKKGGTAAGVPRSVGEAQSSATNGAAKDQAADNDEYCSACGNAGDVVCCDGCPRSFHFECVDMIQSEDLPDEWYCNECLVKRHPSRVPVHKGVFGGPLNLLEKSIPRAFSLPKRVQNRFEGVKAGADGDYEEVSTTKATRRKNNGYEESPDFFKQREEGEAVLCHDCQKPATDVRAIVSCSVCRLHWHIDCLDPPLAVPPVLKTWRCPAHADDLLVEAPPLAPAHRYRKVKGATAITPAISRGLKNNGHIEIDWSSEPEEADHSGWRDMASFGRTYKISAKSVRLDFIEQLRKQGAGYGPRHDALRRVEPYLTPPVEDAAQPPPAAAVDRDVEEMQASLVLTSLKAAPTDGIEQLAAALLSSADPNVISLIAKGDAGNIASEQLADHDKISLRTLLSQVETMGSRIRHLLGDEARSPLPTTLGGQGPPSTSADSKGTVDKMDSEPLVTEPTPPSTIDHEGAMDFE